MTWDFLGIELDDDGYPTEESLKSLKEQPMDFFSAARFLVSGLPQFNRYEEMACAVEDSVDAFTNEKKKVVRFSTLGWSGNEEIMAVALDRFDVGHFVTQWTKGGHYIFEVPVAMLEKPKNSQEDL